jgi:hypothetical protein
MGRAARRISVPKVIVRVHLRWIKDVKMAFEP